MIREYKKDIRINENNLEDEWINQPSLFLYYAEAHAEAIHERDLAKAKTEYVYAIMYSDIKTNWEKSFDNKPTEPAIKESILKHPKYKKSERAFIDASKNMNLMLAAKTAFDHRKMALSNLTSLKIGGFYSEPRNKKQDVDNMKTAQRRTLSKRKNLNHKKP